MRAKPSQLQNEIDSLREENRQLRAMVFGESNHVLIAQFGLTEHQARVFGCLIQNEVASYRILEAALWWDKGDAPYDGDNVIKVHMVHIRKKVPEWARPANVWGIGYRLLPDARKRLKAMLAGGGDE